MAKRKPVPQAKVSAPSVGSAPPARPVTFNYLPAIVIACAVLLYLNTLGHGFVLDDDLAIKLHPHVIKGIGGWVDILFSPYRADNFGGALYRPISLMQFALEWQLAPDTPAIHHFFQVLWYAVLIWGVLKLARQWFANWPVWVAGGAALFFAAHPIHTEVVANIKSRDELMSLLGIVWSLYFWSRHLLTGKSKHLFFSVILWLLALLSKEGALPLLPLFPLAALILHKKPVNTALKSSFFFLLAVAFYFVLRYLALGKIIGGSIPDVNDNNIVLAQTFGERLATGGSLLWQYLRLLIWPHPLSSDYSYNVLPVVGIGHPKALLGLVIHGILIALSIWGLIRRSWWSFFVIGYLLSVLLFSQVFITIGTIFGERLIFTGSLFYCLLAIGLVATALKSNILRDVDHEKNQVLWWGLTGIPIAAFAFLTISRNAAWKDNLTLFRKDVQTYPQSVRLQNFAAVTQLNALKADTTANQMTIDSLHKYCIERLEASLSIRPTPTAHQTLGLIKFDQKNYPEAIAHFKKSRALFQDLPGLTEQLLRSYTTYAAQLGPEGKIDEARSLLLEAIQLAPNDAESHYLLGVSYGIQNQHAVALPYFEKAFRLNNQEPRYQSALQLARTKVGKQ